MSIDINRCLTCEAYEPGYGCTHPEISYPCPALDESDLEIEDMLLIIDDLSGQMDMFANTEDDYPY